jgi:hypothetical protein
MNLELTTCHGPDRSNEINLRDLVQDVCRAELAILDGDIGSIEMKLTDLQDYESFKFSRLNQKINAMQEQIKALEKQLSSSNPTSPACYHNRCRVLPSQAESHSQLSPCNETHQSSKQETLLRSSTHQIQLSDRTRFVWFDIDMAQGLLHVRVEEYS